MQERTIHVGDNIKILRGIYGETQTELGNIVGVEGNTISQYENNNRLPRYDFLTSISNHYRITDEELMYGDCTEYAFPDLIFNGSIAWMIRTSIFPTFHSSNAMNNDYFKEGYIAHKEIIDSMPNPYQISDRLFDKCLDNYLCVYFDYDIVEALANLLYWYIPLEMYLNNLDVYVKGSDYFSKGKRNLKDFAKKAYLRSGRVDYDILFSSEGIAEKDLHDLSDWINEMLENLYAHPEWRDLVEYYSSIRYMFGCVKNRNSIDVNKRIGIEMITMYIKCGNQYAKRFNALINKMVQTSNTF